MFDSKNVEIIKQGEYEIIIQSNQDVNIFEPLVNAICDVLSLIVKNFFN